MFASSGKGRCALINIESSTNKLIGVMGNRVVVSVELLFYCWLTIAVFGFVELLFCGCVAVVNGMKYISAVTDNKGFMNCKKKP